MLNDKTDLTFSNSSFSTEVRLKLKNQFIYSGFALRFSPKIVPHVTLTKLQLLPFTTAWEEVYMFQDSSCNDTPILSRHVFNEVSF